MSDVTTIMNHCSLDKSLILNQAKKYTPKFREFYSEFLQPLVTNASKLDLSKSDNILNHMLIRLLSDCSRFHDTLQRILNNSERSKDKDLDTPYAMERAAVSTVAEFSVKSFPIVFKYGQLIPSLMKMLTLRKKNFESFLKSCSEKDLFKHLPISGYLILPLKYFHYLELILENIWKFSSKTHSEYDQMRIAIGYGRKYTEGLRNSDLPLKRLTRTLEIHSAFIRSANPYEDALKPHRELVYEGEVSLVGKGGSTRRIALFLFNDLLLLSAKKPLPKPSKTSIEWPDFSNNVYEMKQIIALDKCWLVDFGYKTKFPTITLLIMDNVSKNMMKADNGESGISCRLEMFVCESESERDAWIDTLSLTITKNAGESKDSFDLRSMIATIMKLGDYQVTKHDPTDKTVERIFNLNKRTHRLNRINIYPEESIIHL